VDPERAQAIERKLRSVVAALDGGLN
jgi:hypothetical protein